MFIFITLQIIGGISLFILFALYPQLSDILKKKNKYFKKSFQNTGDIILMYKTFRRTKSKTDKNILLAGMIFYLISFTCIVLGIIMVFIDF